MGPKIRLMKPKCQADEYSFVQSSPSQPLQRCTYRRLSSHDHQKLPSHQNFNRLRAEVKWSSTIFSLHRIMLLLQLLLQVSAYLPGKSEC